ncbi:MULTISPECIES: ABC transporter permease [unclassified Streptomyces]|uniref:ABC transporter permease n=1 Tax=unclassified Streptomyces TaxID=2593676 RepID=UPI002DD82FFE|nr:MULTISPECIES: ABC transporter permease [unclassified Streptomyces]WSA94470.1 ABC transporter permease [Streptomyces sp. NBC_01795]WSB78889.1 ABC transporter permease [Streptomyces sp. NBC_01775]WSS12909.1 ABC transporter permease [Streptomyces sp. NBC_01186]WSS41692.1 ABC transporter permease [Streptomyces sp. NBC_01187]
MSGERPRAPDVQSEPPLLQALEHEADGVEDPNPEDHRTPPPAPAEGRFSRLTWPKLLVLPLVLALGLLGTWLWFRGAELDSIARNSLTRANVELRLRQHIELTVISTFFVLIIAIPLGIVLTRKRLRKAAPIAMIFANLGQAVPALGLLILLVIWLGVGPHAAIVGIVIYAVLPVLANTIAGLRAIDPALVEAAKGVGMSPVGVLRKVELPLAVPLILAGVRNALVLNVGTATLATFGGGGGLGDLISDGITNQRMPVLYLGSILTVALALLVDWLASLAELLLRPLGLEGPA